MSSDPQNVVCRVLAAAGHADLDKCHQLAATICTELGLTEFGVGDVHWWSTRYFPHPVEGATE